MVGMDGVLKFSLLKLLREMEEQGVPPDITGLNAAIDACKQAGDGAEALRLLRGLRARGLVPDVATFTAAVGAQVFPICSMTNT